MQQRKIESTGVKQDQIQEFIRMCNKFSSSYSIYDTIYHSNNVEKTLFFRETIKNSGFFYLHSS